MTLNHICAVVSFAYAPPARASNSLTVWLLCAPPPPASFYSKLGGLTKRHITHPFKPAGQCLKAMQCIIVYFKILSVKLDLHETHDNIKDCKQLRESRLSSWLWGLWYKNCLCRKNFTLSHKSIWQKFNSLLPSLDSGVFGTFYCLKGSCLV